jgi:hypothetical protein
MKIKRKSYIKFTAIFILLIFSAFSIYIVYNLGTILDVGHYELTDNDRVDAENVKIDVQYLIDLRFDKYTDYYEGVFRITSSSNQSTKVKGISFVDCQILKNDEILHLENIKFDDPKEQFESEFLAKLNRDDNLTAFGYITFLISDGGELKEYTSEFRMELSMNVSTWELVYQFEIGRLWLEYLCVICFFILTFFLVRSIKQLYFQKKLPLREKLRSDAYFEYIKEESKRRKRDEIY